MTDRKRSTIEAMNRFYQKQLDENSLAPNKKKTTRNAKPEKEVEKACMDLMKSWGWSVSIFEAKATWNPQRNCWMNQAMKAGTCDCMGSTDEGISVAVEFKALGKRSSFNTEKRHLQKQFILDKIESNAFACVVDSGAMLTEIYNEWKKYRLIDLGQAKRYLISMLPKVSNAKLKKDDNLFDDDF